MFKGGAISEPSTVGKVGFWLRSNMFRHYWIVTGALIVLTLLVIYLFFFGNEGFNPTATMRYLKSDQVGLGRMEAMDSRHDEFRLFGSNVGKMSAGDVLASDKMGCFNAKSGGKADAWAWLSGHAHQKEGMTGVPVTDSDFTRILAGQ